MNYVAIIVDDQITSIPIMHVDESTFSEMTHQFIESGSPFTIRAWLHACDWSVDPIHLPVFAEE